MFSYYHNMNPITAAFKRVAWKRTLIIAAVFGMLTTVGAPKSDTEDSAVGHFIGASIAYTVMLGGACAACAKPRSIA